MAIKEFNTQGICLPQWHYMVDTSEKLVKISELIDNGKYFTINRPRQYGKTTTLYLLKKKLKDKYLVINLTFEDLDVSIYETYPSFIKVFLIMLLEQLENQELPTEALQLLRESSAEAKDMFSLSRVLSKLNRLVAPQKMVLMIDEVDKSSNNQLFLDFLGMLRTKYLKKAAEEDTTFHSVILAGVHDVKTLKLKLRPEEQQRFNSPWNIAVDFEIDLSFNPAEIATMLEDYQRERQVELPITELARQLYFYTSGYPFLVSRLCEIIETKLEQEDKWSLAGLEAAVKIFLQESNPNFESLIKNIENNLELAKYVRDLIIEGYTYTYNIDNPVIYLGTLYGIFKKQHNQLAIHNNIYAQRIYNYLSSKIEGEIVGYSFRDNFITNQELQMEKIIQKFQQFMREQYSQKDQKFIEREGRLLMLAFLKPIINGIGFDFKEVQISEEKRLDVVLTFYNHKYVLELKRWYGEQAHQEGLKQLADYLERQNLERGYLVVFDFNKQKEKAPWQEDRQKVKGKEIYMVRV